MKKVIKENDIAIYWLENINPFFLICPWQGVHFTEGRTQGREYEVFHSVQEGDYDAKRGAQKLNMTLEDFLKKMKQTGFS